MAVTIGSDTEPLPHQHAQQHTQQHTGTAGRPAVPWSTVLPLAVVLTYADGFWTTALRTAVGSIERTDSPFTSWMRESTLMLPMFVLAVLGGLVLAQRSYGPQPRGPKAVAGALLTVVGLGTLAGAGELAASSAYDYHLQSAQLSQMSLMRGTCAAACQSEQLRQTLNLQVRSVVIGTVILLVTNLVLAGWLVALRGGRLRLAATRQPTARQPSAGGPAPLDRLGPVRVVLVAGLLGSGVIHAAVVPAHLAQWTAAGVFLGLLSAVELALAGLVLVWCRPGVLLACGIASAGLLLLWGWSRLLGLPFGPASGVPEAIGMADLAASALELATLVAAVVLFRRRPSAAPVATSANACRLAVVAAVAVTAVGLAGCDLSWVDLGAGDGGSVATIHH